MQILSWLGSYSEKRLAEEYFLCSVKNSVVEDGMMHFGMFMLWKQ